MVAIPLRPQTRQYMIALTNIAAFAVLALEQPDRLSGRRIDVAGDVLTGEDMARTLAEVTGREMRYFEVPKQVVRETMSDDLAIMFEYYDQQQPTVDLDSLRREFPEVGLLTFREWAQQQDWKRFMR
jgi:nucleoside-diphosphate-sugar epimerase